MNAKYKIFLIVCSLSFILLGCGDDATEGCNDAIENGLDSLIIEDYDKAQSFFEIATQISDEEKASVLLNQVQLVIEAIDLLENEDFEATVATAEQVIALENGSIALTEKANDILNEARPVAEKRAELSKKLDETRALDEAGKLDEALELVQTVMDDDQINNPYYADFKTESDDLYLSLHLKKEEIVQKEIGRQQEAQRQAEAESKEALEPTTADFENLPLEIKVQLTVSSIDERAYNSDLAGYQLYYAIDGDYLLARVTSGAGLGHPLYLIELSSDWVTPVSGVHYSGANTIVDTPGYYIGISKKNLFKMYQKNRDAYDAGQSKIVVDNGFSVDYYNELRAQIQ